MAQSRVFGILFGVANAEVEFAAIFGSGAMVIALCRRFCTQRVPLLLTFFGGHIVD